MVRGLGVQEGRRSERQILPCRRNWNGGDSSRIGGWRRFYNEEKMEEMEPQGGGPAYPHPHHNGHLGKQDEDRASPGSLLQHPPPASAGQAAPFKPCAHGDQDVGTQEWTSPDVDNSATPVPGLRSYKPNTPCGLGRSQAPTPQLTGPQLPCCIRFLSACTHPRACYTTVVCAPSTHTASPGGLTVPQRKLQSCLHSTGPSVQLLASSAGGEVGRAPGPDPGFCRLYPWLIIKPQEATSPLRASFPN